MDKCVRGMRAACLVGLITVAAACGCSGDPDATPAVPAAGSVTYKGKPIEVGDIVFVPAKGRSAHGVIEKGAFKLTTYADGDGALPGKHKVAVTSYKEVLITKGTNKGDTDRVSLIPQDYGSPEYSRIEVDLPAEGNTEIKLDLK